MRLDRITARVSTLALLSAVGCGAHSPAADPASAQPAPATQPAAAAAAYDAPRFDRTMAWVREKFPQVTQLSTQDLAEQLKAPADQRPLLYDARAPQEFAVSRIPGSVWLDPDRNAAQQLAGVPKDKLIVIYCSVGYRSSRSASQLLSAGFANVANLEGSIFKWANEGRPIESADPKPQVHPFNDDWGRLLRSDMRWQASADVPKLSAAQPLVNHQPLADFYALYVQNGQVDYLGVRSTGLPQLDAYLSDMAQIDDAILPQKDRLAYFCNLYNATMIRLVAVRYRVGFRPSENGFAIFKEPSVRLKHRTITLDELEHGIIRKGFSDPRIHAALVCAAKDCPVLPAEPYTAENLDATFDKLMTDWITSPAHTTYLPEKKVIRVSRLFRSYAADFGGQEKLPAYIDQYHPDDLTGFELQFHPTYDWTPNIKPPQGRWVWAHQPSVTLYDAPDGNQSFVLGLGAVVEVASEKDGYLQLKRALSERTDWVRSDQLRPYPPESAPAP